MKHLYLGVHETGSRPVAGLLVLISSQFRDRDFSAGPDLIGSASWLDTQGMEASTGALFSESNYPRGLGGKPASTTSIGQS